jgi:hypothetical protein
VKLFWVFQGLAYAVTLMDIRMSLQQLNICAQRGLQTAVLWVVGRVVFWEFPKVSEIPAASIIREIC